MRKGTVLTFKNHYHAVVDADKVIGRESGSVTPTNDGLVPAVDPADLKSVWSMQNDSQARHPDQLVAISIDACKSACKPGADVSAVCSRALLLGMLENEAESRHFEFPWMHDGRPEEMIFKIVATIPMVRLQPGVKREGFPIDVEELIRQIKAKSKT